MSGISRWWHQLGSVSGTTWIFSVIAIVLGAVIVVMSLILGSKIYNPAVNYGFQCAAGGFLIFLFGFVWLFASVLDATTALAHPYLYLWGGWFILLLVIGVPAAWSAYRKYNPRR